MWRVPKIWAGGEVWIVGGGASLITQFDIPEEVTKDVRQGRLPLSAYSPYMLFLHDKHVIGINVAYKLGNWIDFCFFGDNSFYLKEQKAMMDFKGVLVSCASETFNDPNIKYMSLNKFHRRGISDLNGTVCWNKTSGAASISLAYQLGVKRIYLLGFDMSVNKNHSHFHNEYIKRGAAVRKDFSNHLDGFAAIKIDAAKLGVEIINVSPDSMIKEFPKVTLQSLMK